MAGRSAGSPAGGGHVVLDADIDLSTARSAPVWNELNDLLRDRRTDLYDPLLGYRGGSVFPR